MASSITGDDGSRKKDYDGFRKKDLELAESKLRTVEGDNFPAPRNNDVISNSEDRFENDGGLGKFEVTPRYRSDRFFSSTQTPESFRSQSLQLDYSQSNSTNSSKILGTDRKSSSTSSPQLLATVRQLDNTPSTSYQSTQYEPVQEKGNVDDEQKDRSAISSQKKMSTIDWPSMEISTIDNPTRPRFDSEEYYRALAESHASSNRYGFNVNRSPQENHGSQESLQGSVLYYDTNSVETGNGSNPHDNFHKNLNSYNTQSKFFLNRDRVSSVDSTGSLIFHKKNLGYTSSPGFTSSNTNSSPERITNRPPQTAPHKKDHQKHTAKLTPKVLPYHKRKQLAEREKSKILEHESNSALRTNKLTTISPINFSNNQTNSHQKQEINRPPSQKITHSNNIPADESTSDRRMLNFNSTGSAKLTLARNISVSSDSSNQSIENQEHIDTIRSNNKVGLPLHPSRGAVKDMATNNHLESATNPQHQLQPLSAEYHIRADSSGSVSSLGSHTGGAGSIARNTGGSLTDRLGKEIKSFLRDSSGHFHGILGTSPNNETYNIEDTRAEFHSKNQAFLQKAEKERNKRNLLLSDLSPISHPNRVMRSRSPRPPNSQGAHRPGLQSIDNDNWEEDDKNVNGSSKTETHHSHRGRSKKNSSHHKDLDPNPNNKDLSERYKHQGFLKSHTRDYRSPHPNAHNHQSALEKRHQKIFDCDLRHHPSQGIRDRKEMVKRTYGATGDKSHRHSNDYHLRNTLKKDNRSKSRGHFVADESSFSSSYFSSSSEYESSLLESSQTDSETPCDDFEEINEQSHLLPPSGISTYESKDSKRRLKKKYLDGKKNTLRKGGNDIMRHNRGKKPRKKERFNREDIRLWEEHQRKKKQRKKRENKNYTRHYSKRKQSFEFSTDDDSFSDDSDYQYRDWAKRKVKKMFIQERDKLLENWKAEARAEAEALRLEQEKRRWYNRLRECIFLKLNQCSISMGKFLSNVENFISNLPLTIGAIALAIVTLGVVWFKFAEENMDSCEPVHFHSSQCSFPEFPGCFYCDTSAKMYRVAVNFHYFCSIISGLLALLFFAKIFLAWRVVLDEMSSPTTSSPAGLICMTMVCTFAGRGLIGQFLVSLAACMHLCLAVWFVYLALAYNIMPEPSWYPNTVGIGLSAVKTWLYYPLPGQFLMAISLSLNIFFFPLSLVRVTLNKKISAPVSWMQMSAPAVALYALTIMAQPSFEEEHPDVTQFQRIHRRVYMPFMHFLFLNSLIGAISSVHGLISRWDSFSKKEFSPAHAAFCFPTLTHANAVQAYRGAIDAFSDITPGSPLKIAIWCYWFFVLVSGTIATLIITVKFFRRLPGWTQVDITDEDEPPAPNETVMSEVIQIGESVRQMYVSPAVLQANETGQLIRHRDADGRTRYVRTRRVTALGFEPIMNQIELQEERDALLEWAAKNPPRTRKRTLSVPGIDFNYGLGTDFGTGNSGVWFDTEANAFRDRAYSERF